MNDKLEKLAYTVSQAAEATGISETNLRQFMYDGKLPAVRNGRTIILRKSDLEEMLNNLPAWEPPRR